MSAWIKLVHPETGGRTRVPSEPHVVEDFAERGWEVDHSDDGPEIFVAPRDPKPPAEPEESPPPRRRRGTATSAVADGVSTEE